MNVTTLFRIDSRRRLLALFLAVALWLTLGQGVALADRWGPPYQAHVTTDRAVVYTQPNTSSSVVGPLWRDAIVVVIDEKVGRDGNSWVQIPDGYMLADDVAEFYTPWTAEVSVPRVSLYAKPYIASGVMRTAIQGDLLRVTGVAHGLEGDDGTWWVTTVGYAPLRSIRWATNDWAGWWQLPSASDAPKGWWGMLIQEAHVRAAPSTQAPVLGIFSGGEHVKVLAEVQGSAIDGDSNWYRIDGGRYAGGYVHGSVVRKIADPKPNTTPPSGNGASEWIVVDRSASSLTFVRDGKPFFVTYVSLGLAGVATPVGTYSTFGKFFADRMSSRNVENPTHPYDLPNVPFTQYYKEGGYGIHGTYWHDLFGSQESQGCINLTWTDAAYLFQLTDPVVPAGSIMAWGQPGNETPVVILD